MLTSVTDISNNITKNRKQKMEYIKRSIDIVDESICRNIYNMIRKRHGEKCIRETNNNEGIYVDISNLDDDIINSIYDLVDKRVNLLLLK